MAGRTEQSRRARVQGRRRGRRAVPGHWGRLSRDRRPQRRRRGEWRRRRARDRWLQRRISQGRRRDIGRRRGLPTGRSAGAERRRSRMTVDVWHAGALRPLAGRAGGPCADNQEHRGEHDDSERIASLRNIHQWPEGTRSPLALSHPMRPDVEAREPATPPVCHREAFSGPLSTKAMGAQSSRRSAMLSLPVILNSLTPDDHT